MLITYINMVAAYSRTEEEMRDFLKRMLPFFYRRRCPGKATAFLNGKNNLISPA